MKRNNHMWTKDELKKIIKLWDSMTIDELADEMDVKRSAIISIATRFRKMGVKLLSKHRRGYLENLMKQVAQEVR